MDWVRGFTYLCCAISHTWRYRRGEIFGSSKENPFEAMF